MTEHQSGEPSRPVNRGLIGLAVVVALGVVAYLALYPQALRRSPIYQYATLKLTPERDRHIHDLAGVLPPADLPRFEDYMRRIVRESDVDIRMVFVKGTGEKTIEQMAADWFDTMRIGARTGNQRGLLLFYDVDKQRLKIEVGYGLEGYFPDVFVSYLVRDHARMFFESGDLSMGLRLMLRLLQHRIREAVIGNDFDPRVIERLGSGGYLSGGAGTSADMRGGTAQKNAAAGIGDSRTGGFNAQDTAEGTYAIYLEWLSQPGRNPNEDFFTEESRRYIGGLPISRAYSDFILIGEYGKRFRIVQRGNLAVLYFTGTPLVSPHFFVKQDGRWRLDMIAEVMNTREYAGGVYTWGYHDDGDPYTRAFSGLLSKMRGYLRFTDGDNRPLVIRGDK